MAIQAKDILGEWNVKTLFVSDKSIRIDTPCHYAFNFGGTFSYTMTNNGIKVDLHESGRWTYDESNAQLMLSFQGEDGKPLPDQHYTCEVTEADSRVLKFKYADVNGIVSRVELNAATS